MPCGVLLFVCPPSLFQKPIRKSPTLAISLQVGVAHTTRPRDVPSSPECRGRVVRVRQAQHLTARALRAVPYAIASGVGGLLHDAALVGVPEGVDAVGDAEEAGVAAGLRAGAFGGVCDVVEGVCGGEAEGVCGVAVGHGGSEGLHGVCAGWVVLEGVVGRPRGTLTVDGRGVHSRCRRDRFRHGDGRRVCREGGEAHAGARC